MNPNTVEIETLTHQLNEWRIKIDFLYEKQKVAAKTATTLTNELEELRTKYRMATQKLHGQDVDKTGSYYMWENIGDGG